MWSHILVGGIMYVIGVSVGAIVTGLSMLIWRKYRASQAQGLGLSDIR